MRREQCSSSLATGTAAATAALDDRAAIDRAPSSRGRLGQELTLSAPCG